MKTLTGGAAPERLTVGGDEMALHVTTDMSDGALIAYEVRIGPGGGPPMLHRHTAFELFRLDRGELTFYLEDEGGDVTRSTAGAGDVVAIPGGREHTVRNESAAAASAFVVLSPGAAMEAFARAAAHVSGIDEVLAAAAANGIEITRPIP